MVYVRYSRAGNGLRSTLFSLCPRDVTMVTLYHKHYFLSRPAVNRMAEHSDVMMRTSLSDLFMTMMGVNISLSVISGGIPHGEFSCSGCYPGGFWVTRSRVCVSLRRLHRSSWRSMKREG